MAADALTIIPGAVLRNLADKLYEKRKIAVLEVRDFRFFRQSSGRGSRPSDCGGFEAGFVLLQIEGIVKQLSMAEEHEKIAAVIFLLTHDFANSS
jgi:vacuole morphology and inheritance protein 14